MAALQSRLLPEQLAKLPERPSGNVKSRLRQAAAENKTCQLDCLHNTLNVHRLRHYTRLKRTQRIQPFCKRTTLGQGLVPDEREPPPVADASLHGRGRRLENEVASQNRYGRKEARTSPGSMRGARGWPRSTELPEKRCTSSLQYGSAWCFLIFGIEDDLDRRQSTRARIFPSHSENEWSRGRER